MVRMDNREDSTIGLVPSDYAIYFCPDSVQLCIHGLPGKPVDSDIYVRGCFSVIFFQCDYFCDLGSLCTDRE